MKIRKHLYRKKTEEENEKESVTQDCTEKLSQ